MSSTERPGLSLPGRDAETRVTPEMGDVIHSALLASSTPISGDNPARRDADEQTVRDALMDSQYMAGVTAGWNAAQDDDPETALAALQASREGRFAGFKEAKARLSTPSDGWLEIGSAPETGKFLVIDAGEPNRTWVAWRSYGQIVSSHDNGRLIQLTHWRPLPAPPITPEPGK